MNTEDKAVLELWIFSGGVQVRQWTEEYEYRGDRHVVPAFAQAIRDQEAEKHKAEVAEIERLKGQVAMLRDELLRYKANYRRSDFNPHVFAMRADDAISATSSTAARFVAVVKAQALEEFSSRLHEDAWAIQSVLNYNPHSVNQEERLRTERLITEKRVRGEVAEELTHMAAELRTARKDGE